jgi:two-component system sensor histidine kinase CpxA
MNKRPHFPLLAKVLILLVLHLVILGLTFVGFVRWQLNLGLDSLLSGSAGERLAVLGDAALSRMVGLAPSEWHDVIAPLAKERDVTAAVFDPMGDAVFPIPVPPNVIDRARASMPPKRPGPQGPPQGPQGYPGARFDPPPEPDFGDPPSSPAKQPAFLPKSKPVFLMRGEDGGYWAGVVLGLPPSRGMQDHPVLLLVHADRLDGSGMFFDFKPWLLGGVAVLLLSLAFWMPFVWGASRYLRRLTAVADEIAAGRFHVALPARGDEFGQLGRAIESMAARLDHLVGGQKRFLGDAAHELCAPLARIRTALGILDAKLAEAEPALLSSIEADTSELATLVDEILAFSRAGNRKPAMQSVLLEPLVREVVARESADLNTEIAIPQGLEVVTDPRLLGRAVGNLVRNAAIHAGAGAKVRVDAEKTANMVVIRVADNGPGVPAHEVSRIFEPFHRLDPARGRETGGSGLGLAIVRTAIEACGGEVSATLPATGGLCITIALPASRAT